MRTTRLGAERFQSEIIKVLVTAAICAYVQIHGAGTVSPPCLDLSQADHERLKRDRSLSLPVCLVPDLIGELLTFLKTMRLYRLLRF